MQLGLADKVAIVTGGSKGIGRATALGFIEEGAAVLVCARGKDALEETVRLAGEKNEGRIVGMQADLTKGEDISGVVARCIETFGRVDILVNNAGSARPGDFLTLPDEAWLEDWTLKFFGYVRMARAVFPHMQRQRGGVIINIIGTGALKPMGSYMIGGAANAALNHFTKALADEGAKHSVRVVGVNPGPILTERLQRFLSTFSPGSSSAEDALARMTPLGRVGKPEEVADLVLFLASARATFIHGANITIDGGANPGLMG
ncbi:MAG: SDR family oxidoreductase [Thermodesulfobacteriota bacterium]|jgi:NAD(P)-dependent dehydrogenase (short-subunit alcohol dehydrogenase family)